MEFHEFECDREAPHAQFGLRFAQALSRGDFAAASKMLTPALQVAYSPEALSDRYVEMIGAESGPPNLVEIMTTMTDWPDKLADDVGWVYVAIAGHMYSEAVTCIVVSSPSDFRIRSIEWGRP